MQVSRAPRCFGTRVMLIASAAAAIMGWAYSVPVYSASGHSRAHLSPDTPHRRFLFRL